MKLIGHTCRSCKKYSRVVFTEDKSLFCPQCSASWGRQIGENIFENCLGCNCRHFYKHKDFNQALGCLIMLAAILLVPATYGLSLPVLAGVDWLLYRKTSEVVLCYKCGMEFRGFSIPSRIHAFEHALGEKFQEKQERDEKKS